MPSKIALTFEQRKKAFWDKVDIKDPNDCWLWLGATGVGYGRFWNGTDAVWAHKYAKELSTGKSTPYNKLTLHSCNNKLCVNPNHIYYGTYQDNSRDRKATGYSHRSLPRFYTGEIWLMQRLYTAGYSYTEIGNMFLCSNQVARRNIKGLTLAKGDSNDLS